MDRPRFFLLGALVLAAALAVPMTAGAAKRDDPAGPACADVVDGGGSYDRGVLAVIVNLAAPSCRNVTYTLHVMHDPSSTTDLATKSVLGTKEVDTTGRPYLAISMPFESADAQACFYVTTERKLRGFDRANDTGCDIDYDTPNNCPPGEDPAIICPVSFFLH